MIILQLGGGLGNQMFEYCFAKWLQNETNEKIIFDCNDIKKNEIEDREFSLINFNIAETHIGNKYLKIENLEPGQEIEYKVNFKYQDIKKMKISEATAEEVKNATESEFEITEEMKQGMLIGTLLILLLK